MSSNPLPLASLKHASSLVVPRAAAVATGCRVEIKLGLAYHDLSQNPALGEYNCWKELAMSNIVLAKEFARIVSTRYGMATDNNDSLMAASTDFVSKLCTCAHLNRILT